MLCQMCGKRTATTHVKSVVNGKLTEYHLCSECAREKGYGSVFGGWGTDFSSLLGGLMGTPRREENSVRCEKCGMTFEEISRTGKVGCDECYTAFRGRLLPVIQRVHGSARHKGKAPGSSALRIVDTQNKMAPVKESPLEEKKRLLKNAIEAQEFEKAALLRDEIKEMERHE